MKSFWYIIINFIHVLESLKNLKFIKFVNVLVQVIKAFTYAIIYLKNASLVYFNLLLYSV